MFNSARAFLLTLAATFALLTTMWVTAAHADTNGVGCRYVGDGVQMCDGAGWQLPSAPRGAARRLPRVDVRRTATVKGSSDIGAPSARVGHTVVIARLGTRI